MDEEASARVVGPAPIETRRLLLRPLLGADADAREELTGGPVSPGRTDLADARAWMARARLSPEALVLAIIERQSGRLIGSAGIAPMSDQPARRELMLWIGEPFAGRGYGTEAGQVMVDQAFAAAELDLLWAVCRYTNSAARRLMEKCGFQFRERGMARSVALRGAVPVERFALDRRTWSSLRTWGGKYGHDDDAHAPAA